MPLDFLLQEDGDKLLLEDGSGFLILESSQISLGNIPIVSVRLLRVTLKTNVMRYSAPQRLIRTTAKIKFGG